MPSGRITLASLIALIAILVLAAVLWLVVLPSLGGRRRLQPWPSIIQLQGLHRALATASNANRGYYPGLDSSGNAIENGAATNFSGDGHTVEGRYALIFRAKLIEPSAAISRDPRDRDAAIWQPGTDWDRPVARTNYSFSLLQITEPGPRRAEWSNTGNSRATVVSERNTGTGTAASGPDHAASLHNAAHWAGAVVCNDGHSEWQESNVFPETVYGNWRDYKITTDDNIFERQSTGDAYLIHTGR